MLKTNATCLRAMVFPSGRVAFWTYHIRTIRSLYVGGGKHGFWLPKLKGITWGRRSWRVGDIGWLATEKTKKHSIRRRLDAGCPFPQTKGGALRLAIYERRQRLRDDIRRAERRRIVMELKALRKAQEGLVPKLRFKHKM